MRRPTCWVWAWWEWPRSAPPTGWAPIARSPRMPPSSSWPGWPGAGSAAGHVPATQRPRTSERITVEVKIGVQSITRELVVDTPSSPDEVERSLLTALTNGGMFVVRDEKGGKILIPADKIGYVELNGTEQRRIGFGNL